MTQQQPCLILQHEACLPSPGSPFFPSPPTHTPTHLQPRLILPHQLPLDHRQLLPQRMALACPAFGLLSASPQLAL